jgi:hypothetical protein
VGLPPLTLLPLLLIIIGIMIVGALLMPRSPQSYRSMSDLRFVGALFLFGLGLELLIQLMQLGKPSFTLGLVGGAQLVRLIERNWRD